MSNIPEELVYTESHEWVRKESDGSITVGVTDHAQSMLGDLVFVDLPEEELEVSRDEECCVLESVKAAADVYAPVSGVIVEVNHELDSTPEVINKEPYDAGWLFRMIPSDEKEFEDLLDAEAYQECVKAEAH
ncbi:MAG: glycine cleavage system protein H [Gammaproteobacteria bacterium RIFCSPHIGHO2_12_FULL_35_23]|nr:MAG: glycine cleavage system protein H [Gammaproteobacteria bacterium RIFCSPHIGHO2_12_FULL_35_23]